MPAFAYIVALLVSVAFASRYFLFSGFDRMSGDVGDARLVLAFMEHWLAVFCGATKWDTPLYFYPFPRALGLQDGFFLMGLMYAPFRLFAQQYVAAEAAFILIRSVGFLSMALLLRNGLRMPHWAAIFGAVLFTIAGNLYRGLGHSQNLSTCFVPILMWLLLVALTRQGSVLALDRSPCLFYHLLCAVVHFVLLRLVLPSIHHHIDSSVGCLLVCENGIVVRHSVGAPDIGVTVAVINFIWSSCGRSGLSVRRSLRAWIAHTWRLAVGDDRSRNKPGERSGFSGSVKPSLGLAP